MGLLKAILDAIHASDDQIGGRAITRLTVGLSETETIDAHVESTIGFGELSDGAGDAKFIVGGEIITATTRLEGPTTYKFTGALSRGQDGTTVKEHKVGTLVFDLSRNQSDIDQVYRGFLVDTAIGRDLDVIGRNLGLKKCIGMTQEQWRAVIKAVAYLPKQTIDAFNQALTALLGAGNYQIYERPITNPWTVFVRVIVTLSVLLRGRFMLNGGEPQLTTGALTVDTTYDVIQSALSDTLTELGAQDPITIEGVKLYFPNSGTGTSAVGVFLDTPAARGGDRTGTNYALGGSVAGNTITMGSSPGGAGTAVLVDYGAFSAHYLAEDETRRDDGDLYAYISDPLLTVRCLLSQIRAAGVLIDLGIKL